MNIYLGENDDEIGLMSLLDDLIVLHNGERYTINGYIIKLQKENKQLKLDYELYKDNHIYKNYEVERKDKQLDLYKEVIEEVRGFIEKHILATETEEVLLQILDKAKDVK